MKVSIEQYAKLCKVSKQAIYGRIERKTITTEIDTETMGYEVQVIDTETYPPTEGELPKGRKKFGSKTL